MKLRFGDFRIDTDTRQLFRGERELHLTPKAFDLLSLLVERRPDAVSKREIHERLWPDTFVTEANVAILIGEIRGVLADRARRPRFIRTVQRFGYAFAADAREAQGGRRTGAICWLVSKRERFALDEGEHLVGRGEDADVPLDYASVSRRHARIIVRKNTATVEDLGSKNGTWVKGRRIVDAEKLQDRDVIRFGSATVTFRTWSAGVTTRSVTPPSS